MPRRTSANPPLPLQPQMVTRCAGTDTEPNGVSSPPYFMSALHNSTRVVGADHGILYNFRLSSIRFCELGILRNARLSRFANSCAGLDLATLSLVD